MIVTDTNQLRKTEMNVRNDQIFFQKENKFSAFLDTYDKETLPRDWLVLGFLSIYTMTSALEAIPHQKNNLEAGQ